MILTPPHAKCPDCSYSLTGLPQVHRCPECGFALDDVTVIVRPTRLWRLYVLAFAVEFVFVFMYSGFVASLLNSVLGAKGAAAICSIAIAIMIVATFLVIHRANRRGRFAAVNRDGISIRNFNETIHIPWSELAIVSFRDVSPWVQRRGMERIVGLRGLFDSKTELECFEEVVSRVRAAAGEERQKTESNAAEDVACIVAPFAPVAGNSGRPTRPPLKPAERLIRRGLILVASGVAASVPVAILTPSQPIWCLPAAILFYPGIVLCLMGLWRSDDHSPRRKRYPPLVRRGLVVAVCGMLAMVSASVLVPNSMAWFLLGEIAFWTGITLFLIGMWQSDKYR